MKRFNSPLTVFLIGSAILLLIGVGCMIQPGERKPQSTMFIGIDASGSFKHSGYYDNSLKFLAHYIYGHLNELGGLRKPKALFVGSVGGKQRDEPKTFHPIHDFEDKNIEKIHKDLQTWFAPDDTLTDFNSFFEEVARITKERNLTLSPITMTIVSDGVPDFSASSKRNGSQKNKYKKIDLQPLEYLSRNITIRLAYVSPVVGKQWREQVPRQRVRLWTVDAEVMKRWPDFIRSDVSLPNQERFWKWLQDNVDFKVKAKRI